MQAPLDKPVDMLEARNRVGVRLSNDTSYCYGELNHHSILGHMHTGHGVSKQHNALGAYMTLRFEQQDDGEFSLSVCFNFRLRGPTFQQALMDCEMLLQALVLSLPKDCFLIDQEQGKYKDHGIKICSSIFESFVTQENFYVFVAQRYPLAVMKHQGTHKWCNHHPWVTIGRLGPKPTWGDVDKLLCGEWLAKHPDAARCVSQGILELSRLQAEEEQLARPADGPESRKRPGEELEADENGSNENSSKTRKA